MSEAELIARLRSRFPSQRAELGIGDDAAILRTHGRQAITCDMLIEDVDFTLAIPLRFIARKSLAVNLSDLAAMGAVPDVFVLALGVPTALVGGLDELFDAFAEASGRFGIELIGGDLSRAAKLTISITAIGSIADDVRPLLRSNAKAGERIYLSRPIGGSATGLALLQRGWSVAADGVASSPASGHAIGYALRELAESAIRRHVDPEPELVLGQRLARIAEVGACIDVSDGLSTDLHHLCDASEVGAKIERERLPIFPDLLGAGPAFGVRVQDAVLHGGEEYALLFTSSLRESELCTRLGRPVYAIGRTTRERGVMLEENGVAAPLEAKGFDHFGGN